MTVNDWLTASSATFQAVGIETGRLDALILLEEAIGKDRAYLLAQPETVLDKSIVDRLEPLVVRRCGHEPMAYIRGKTEFYGREFIVSEWVMVPRPETETMIELMITHAEDMPTIIDIGTGSGILAITAKLELVNRNVIAVDIDEHCLKLARQNAEKLQVEIEFIESDLLDTVPASVLPKSMILANLPYVPDDYEINQAATHEPSLALFGGFDGLELYRQLFGGLSGVSSVYVLTESLPEQHDELAKIASKFGYQLIETKNLVQVFYIGLA